MSWFTFMRNSFGQQPLKRRVRSLRQKIRLHLELCEERLLPSIFTVTDLGDSGLGSDLQGDLRYCITQANANAAHINQIVFQADLTGTVRLAQGALSITKELVIDGPGQDLLTISGNGQSGVFYVSQSAEHENGVFIAGLTISGGTGFSVDGKIEGGGIYTTSADLTLTDVTVSGNSTPGRGDSGGGGIYKAEGTLTLVDCTVADNQVGGGGRSQRGGGVYNASGPLTLISSTLADNRVVSGGNGSFNWGGGIYNEGTLTVRGSTISGNSVGAPGEPSGGGIYNAPNSTLTIRDSAVIGNTALNGGGINNGSPLAFNDPVFVDHSTIFGNRGGGIWSYGLVDLTDSTVAENTEGAGIAAMNFRIERSTISGNIASGYVGGIAEFGGPGTGLIENSTISGNTGGFVGGILVGSSFAGLGNFLTLDHCTIVNNHGHSNAGGIWVGTNGSDHGYVIIGQTIVAGNDVANPIAGSDVDGPVEISRGGNFIGNGAFSSGWSEADRVGAPDAPLDPLLGLLQDNGGPTLTHAPLPGSPLLQGGAGDNSPDQRGSHRLTNAPGAVAYNPATAFRISAPDTVVAGQRFDLAVTATDPWGNTSSIYSGTVHFRSTDPDAQLPDDYTFGTADAGAHTFEAVLQTEGAQLLGVVDTTFPLTSGAVAVDVVDGPPPGAVLQTAGAQGLQIGHVGVPDGQVRTTVQVDSPRAPTGPTASIADVLFSEADLADLGLPSRLPGRKSARVTARY
jgi:hypothetical protein